MIRMLLISFGQNWISLLDEIAYEGYIIQSNL